MTTKPGYRWNRLLDLTDEIVAAYRSGKSLAEIGRSISASKTSIKRVLILAGVPIRNQAPPQRKKPPSSWSDAELALMREYYPRSGTTQLRGMLGRPAVAIKSKAARMGLSAPVIGTDVDRAAPEDRDKAAAAFAGIDFGSERFSGPLIDMRRVRPDTAAGMGASTMEWGAW